MKLSVVIPVYNERNTIEEIVGRVTGAPWPEIQVIIVDDCSDDGTREILESEIVNRVDKIIFHDRNRGKGAALRSGFRHATGEIILIQDADLEYDPFEYPKLLKPIIDGRADVVFGSRFAGGEAHRVLFFWHFVGNRVLTTLSNMVTNLNLTDMETCYKVFKRELLEKIDLKENRFGVDPEFTSKIAKLDCRIFEVGISYYGRNYSEGKKISWKDGVRAIWVILKYSILR